MTTPQKVATGTTVLAVLTLLLASQSLPVLQWVFSEIKLFTRLPLFQPVLLAAIVGTVAPAWLPHVLPANWPAHRTKRVTRLLGCGIAFTMVAAQYRSLVGLQFALFAASMAYVGWTMAAGFFYRAMPEKTPPSLQDPPSKGPTP